ncbi:hypothetical protein HYT04_01390 [Candidatus Kaiserbacteria bacterium]|nr:hypothetical protein [Candidatus Kaiserbacteria bacterium]
MKVTSLVLFPSWQAGSRRCLRVQGEIMKLQKLALSAQSVKTMGTFAQDLYNEIKKIERQGAKVYQTYVMDDDHRRTHFVFSTTSKDV